MNIDFLEAERIQYQKMLDSVKERDERNKLGQFATPSELALDILRYTNKFFREDEKVRFLDPAIGTGAFFSALLKTFSEQQIETAQGYEIDPYYANICKTLWGKTPLKLHVEDYTRSINSSIDEKDSNLIVCNPPYSRHHHISKEDKIRLANLTQQITGLKISGLASLYCYFLLISHAKMERNGYAAWLIPNGFMDANYGSVLKDYLLNKVTLIKIHFFDPSNLQFDDALVSSSIVWFKNSPPNEKHFVEFSYGNRLSDPTVCKKISTDELRKISKWTHIQTKSINYEWPIGSILSDWFDIKRGLATGANNFFILSLENVRELNIPEIFLKPILPSPRYVPEEIKADLNGNPEFDKKLFVLTSDYPEEKIKTEYPELWKYLEKGVQEGVSKRYLCSHRKPWYKQESREAAPLLCTYMGRSENGTKPFRFILNHSNALAANVYLLLYPKPLLKNAINKNPKILKDIWKKLCAIPITDIIEEGRVYGGGLHKIEPKELANIPVDWVKDIIP